MLPIYYRKLSEYHTSKFTFCTLGLNAPHTQIQCTGQQHYTRHGPPTHCRCRISLNLEQIEVNNENNLKQLSMNSTDGVHCIGCAWIVKHKYPSSWHDIDSRKGSFKHKRDSEIQTNVESAEWVTGNPFWLCNPWESNNRQIDTNYNGQQRFCPMR